MTATVTPIHARRTGHAVSEGTRSARALLGERTSLTPDPYLLGSTERLHRVDARQLPAGVDGAAVGHCRTDQGLCYGHHACADTACPGHPGTDPQDPQDLDVPETERDRALLIKAVLGYVAFLAACAWATWQWLGR